MIDVAEADRILADPVRPLPACDVPLASAAGRVLRREVRADRDQPPYDRVTMDGVAVASAAVTRGRRAFRRQAVQPAGRPPLALASEEACIEVTTGAVLPPGCDAVVRIEDVEVDGDAVALHEGVTVRPGQNVHARGSDAPEGRVVIERGTRLGPAHVGIAAAMGASTLHVAATPRLAVVSTGDELVEVDARPEPHQVRRSNAHALRAALAAHGHGEVATRHLPDDAAALAEGLATLLDEADVLVLSGGVSMGAFDLVPGVLTGLGVERRFHRVAQRPGKPLWFGVRDGTAVFGLPGNPVSALVCLVRHVLPYLERAAGATPRPRSVRTAGEVRGLARLARFVPVALEAEGAVPVDTNTSGDFLALGRSDGFVEVPAGTERLPAGASLPFRPW